MLYPVEVSDIDNTIPLVVDYIESCLEYSPIPVTVDDIAEGLKADKGMKLFLMFDDNSNLSGALIADVYKNFNTKVMNIFLMSYKPDYFYEDNDCEQLEVLAKKMDVKYLTYYGRRGFLRKHTPKGWKLSQVVMTKEIL